MHVGTLPKQSPYEVGQPYINRARKQVMDEAVDMASQKNVPVTSIMRLARKPAKAIIDSVEDHYIDMVVMGWKGRSKHPETVIGSNIDKVLKDADCDVAILRGSDFGNTRSILIPVAYPEQARLMLEIGRMYRQKQDASLDLCHVVSQRLARNREALDERMESIYEGLKKLNEEPDMEEHPPEREGKQERELPEINIEVSDSIVNTVVGLSKDYQLTIIGATREGWFQKLVAGTNTERIAKSVKGNLILVKSGRTPIQSGLMNVIEFFRSKEPELR